MTRFLSAIVIAAGCALPVMATAQMATAPMPAPASLPAVNPTPVGYTCIDPTQGQSTYDVTYFECVGHAPLAAAAFATEHAANHNERN